MPINFHDATNANTYATRTADETWIRQMQSILGGRHIGRVADIGCGGGIYSRAWKRLGAESVVGVDSSAQMITDARAATTGEGIDFVHADANATSLSDESCDIVFSRAVVHHLDNHANAFAEAYRILKPSGVVIVQDRTIEDVLQPASPSHLRGWFFEVYPRLLQQEHDRRPVTADFLKVLIDAGFTHGETETFWETRRTYATPDELRDDLMARTGRSILHELDDAELHTLADTVVLVTTGVYPLTERDRWTMWTATKP